jgi:hypothetical protein
MNVCMPRVVDVIFSSSTYVCVCGHSYTIEVSPSGSVPAGSVEFPFEFKLRPFDGKQVCSVCVCVCVYVYCE